MNVIVLILLVLWVEVEVIPYVSATSDRHHYCTEKFKLGLCAEASERLIEMRINREKRWESFHAD